MTLGMDTFGIPFRIFFSPIDYYYPSSILWLLLTLNVDDHRTIFRIMILPHGLYLPSLGLVNTFRRAPSLHCGMYRWSGACFSDLFRYEIPL